MKFDAEIGLTRSFRSFIEYLNLSLYIQHILQRCMLCNITVTFLSSYTPKRKTRFAPVQIFDIY